MKLVQKIRTSHTVSARPLVTSLSLSLLLFHTHTHTHILTQIRHLCFFFFCFLFPAIFPRQARMNMRLVIHYKNLIGSVVANTTAPFNTITTHTHSLSCKCPPHLSAILPGLFHNFLVEHSGRPLMQVGKRRVNSGRIFDASL